MKKELPVLITFPRTGSKYLRQLIFTHFSFDIENSHRFPYETERPMITIARNPRDTIMSAKSLEIELRDNHMERLYVMYDNFAEYMLDRADLIVDFDILVKHPDRIIEAISKRFNLKRNTVTENPFKLFTSGDVTDSSRGADSYKESLMDDEDLEKSIILYNSMISRSQM